MSGVDGAAAVPAGETEFGRLVRQLAHDPKAYWADALPVDEDEQVYFPLDPVFDSYCRGAARLVRSGEVDVEALRAMLYEYPWICGNDIDAQDWVTDLLRVVASELGDVELKARIDVEHADVIVREILIHTDRSEFRKALKAGRRALAVVDGAGERGFDPVTHAAILRAMGRAQVVRARRVPDPSDFPPGVLSELGVDPDAIPVQYDYEPLAEGVSLLTQAAELLSSTERSDEWLSLIDALPTYAWPLAHTTAIRNLLGAGRVLTYLETAAAAGRAARETVLLAFASVELASLLSEVRQSARGEEVLRELLEEDDLSSAQRDDATIQLASTLSEQRRFDEAATLQRSLLEGPEGRLDSGRRAALLFNLGNSLLQLGDEDDAVRSWQRALDQIAGDPERERHAGLEARIHTVLAEHHFAAGRVRAAERELAQAEPYFEAAEPDIPTLEFNSRAARGFFLAGRPRKALARIERSEQLLTKILARGPSPSVWESMFTHWHLLPAHAVEILLTRERGEPAARRALAAAEGAKGRLLGWLRFGPTQAGAELALDASRRERVVDGVLAWVGESPGRTAISLFGTDRGLAVLVVLPDGSVRGRWLDEVRYQTFMSDSYEPWAELVDSSTTSERLAIWAGTTTELLLGRLGEWLWRACPELAEGGSELVISSHRLFRSLPLSHCSLPGGARLGEVFERVLVVPSFAELVEALDERTPVLSPDVRALSDPDGTLPFARIEGLMATGGDGFRVGGDVTEDVLRETLELPGIVVLSCHGQFDPANPWASSLKLGDSYLEVARLFETARARNGQLVVLGACETGRNRRSLSDEPLGFPAALVHAGADAVLAPMWRVDDFSSCLYVTRFVSLARAGVHAATAVERTSAWLRDLSAGAALALAEEWRAAVDAREDDRERWSEALARLEEHAGWLRTLEPDGRPFRSARDWAAFQLVGVPPDPPEGGDVRDA